MPHSYFTQALREEMERKDVFQVDIARVLEVSEQYISDIMLGKKGPLKAEYLVRIGRHFGMDVRKLLTARAWTVKQVDVPPFVRYEQVEEVVEALMERRG